MRLIKFYNLIMLKIDLDTGSDVRSACKFIMSLTKTSSKVYKPKTYDKVIDDLIYGNT